MFFVSFIQNYDIKKYSKLDLFICALQVILDNNKIRNNCDYISTMDNLAFNMSFVEAESFGKPYNQEDILNFVCNLYDRTHTKSKNGKRHFYNQMSFIMDLYCSNFFYLTIDYFHCSQLTLHRIKYICDDVLWFMEERHNMYNVSRNRKRKFYDRCAGHLACNLA